MYTELTMHVIQISTPVDTRKTDIAIASLRKGVQYTEYRQELCKQCSKYLDNPMLLTEHQYYQLTYSIEA